MKIVFALSVFTQSETMLNNADLLLKVFYAKIASQMLLRKDILLII